MNPLLWLVKPLPSYYFLFVVAPANTQRPLSCCIFADFFSPNYLLMCIVNTIIWICVPTGMSKFHIVKKTAVDSCVVFCRSKVNFMELNWEYEKSTHEKTAFSSFWSETRDTRLWGPNMKSPFIITRRFVQSTSKKIHSHLRQCYQGMVIGCKIVIV